MKQACREKCGNIGGGLHLLGNFSLACKGMLDQALSGAAVNFSGFFHEFHATISGLLFIVGAFLMSTLGHKNKTHIVCNLLAAAGYAILCWEMTVDVFNIMSLIGLFIGFIASCYAALKASQREDTNGNAVSLLFIPGQYLFNIVRRRPPSQKWLKLKERYPFFLAGLVECVSDFYLLIGSALTDGWSLVCISLFWGIGSIFLTISFPKVLPVQVNGYGHNAQRPTRRPLR